MQDMRFNCRFMDIMRTDPSGSRLVDFRRFNTVIQNTIMPVSYGLTYEETLIVNGEGVLKPQAPRSGGRRSGAPSRSSSRASLATGGGRRSDHADRKFTEEDQAPSGASRGAAGSGGAQRLWRRVGATAAGRTRPAAEDGVPDALGKGGLTVQESEGSGLPDGDGFASSGGEGSSNEDAASPAAIMQKAGSLLPEPTGDMGGVSFNVKQVRLHVVSLLTPLAWGHMPDTHARYPRLIPTPDTHARYPCLLTLRLGVMSGA